ncbi:MAG: ankyrin repeat domain-containing protein [Candidatus Midichloria sp.]|nr:ankyrin repeat domain-containing protein [Candidatus Midichloria sp.]
MIEHDTDVNIGTTGWTPLYRAFGNEDLDLAFLLIKHGANLKDPRVDLLRRVLFKIS